MSDGLGEKGEKKLIVLDPDEFNEVVKRVHEFLLNRAERAKERNDSRPSERSNKNHIEAAKDAFVFVHMMELIEHMSGEIADLRQIISSLGYEPEEGALMPELFLPKKTSYLN